ncbi:hypothetical protein H3O04_02225 [Burkholderia sp. KCJ3K979]|uniref:hypothetical protein n=1 Tax=Burkholderia sp. KCJ3K979 TaxID=2759149 RepID=UPI001929E185|nr:hypothetical protein [Burkholderia sp. KCJ3K979]MBL3961310.1 hypothetical protein [Burkholderia sp. KCJ3K979]
MNRNEGEENEYSEREHIEEAISFAQGGATEEALYLLDMCIAPLYAGAKLDDKLAFYLADCLAKIVAKEDPAKALNLVPSSRKRGRPNASEADQFNDAIAIQATILLAERVKGINKTKALQLLSSSDDPYPRSEWRKLAGTDFSPMKELENQDLIVLAGRRWKSLLSKIG